MRRILASAFCVLLLVAACSSAKKKSTPPPSSTDPSTTVAGSTPGSSAAASTSTVTEVFPTITSLPCQPVPVPRTPVKSVVPGAEVMLVKVDEQGDRCVDHVIFSFTAKASGPPG